MLFCLAFAHQKLRTLRIKLLPLKSNQRMRGQIVLPLEYESIMAAKQTKQGYMRWRKQTCLICFAFLPMYVMAILTQEYTLKL